MSDALDFTDMFRRNGAASKTVPSKPRLTSSKRSTEKVPDEVNVEVQENIPPSTQVKSNVESDSMVYVKNALRNMNFDIQSKDLSQTALQAIEMLYSERCYWQNQSTTVSEECVKLRTSLSNAQRERAREAEAVEALKNENQQVLSRISALTLEHREVKNHWLTEKSELQTRNFQMQALNTQYAGSLKKKEKDFEKLQNQLAKTVKDANKAQAKPAIVMSLPVKKNLSQGAAEPGSALTILKDAEMQAAKKTIITLDAENHVLRASVESLQESMDELNAAFEAAVQQSEAKTRQQLESILHEHAAALHEKEDQLHALQHQLTQLLTERDAQHVRTAAVSNCPVIPETSEPEKEVVQAALPQPPAPPATPAAAKTHIEFMSPSHLRSTVKFKVAATPGSIAKRYLEGTPGARPVQWVVEQANTEVKRLRARAEQIARGEAGAAAVASLDGYAAWTELGRAAEIEAAGTCAGAGAHALWRMKLHSMKLRLSEALLVIQEQDRLIHSALLGRPLAMGEEDCAALSAQSADMLDASPAAATAGVADHSAKEEVLGHLDNMASLQDSDFLPPASPATWALLQSYGWSCLPNKAETGAVPVDAAEVKTTLAGEFDAED